MFKKYGFKITVILSILLLSTVFAYPHSGRTDKYGGHNDRINGGYHYHNSGTVGTFQTTPTTPNGRAAQVNAGAGNTQMQAMVDAEADAAAAANSVLWIGGTFIGTSLAGCLFCGLPSILIASIYEPSPPAARLMGKSPEYIMSYTNTYKGKVKSRQVRDATIGCVGGSVVAAVVWGSYYSSQGY